MKVTFNQRHHGTLPPPRYGTTLDLTHQEDCAGPPGDVHLHLARAAAASRVTSEPDSSWRSLSSNIDADGDIAARQLGKRSCMCPQLRECFVLCHCLLYLSVYFPTGVARRNEPLSGPCAGVKSGKPKKFGAVFFEDCLRLLGCLDHFLRFVGFEARKLYDRHDILPPLSPHPRKYYGSHVADMKRFTMPQLTRQRIASVGLVSEVSAQMLRSVMPPPADPCL